MARILIIEDDREILDLLAGKIEEAGHQALTANDGEEGLRLLREEEPDLLLLDIVLPNVDGLELMKRKQALPETAAIPTIIISNSGAASEISQAQHLGARDWIIKTDFNLQESVDKINEILGQTS